MSFLAFVVLLASHELGHAFFATRRRVHVIAIKLYVLHGKCEYDHPDYEEDEVFIACGGVLFQFGILLLALGLEYSSLLISAELHDFLKPIFFALIFINLLIIITNLIPVQPLDGYLAWSVVPILRRRLKPWVYSVAHRFVSTLGFGKQQEPTKESERAATDLLDRLKKK